MRSNCQIDLRTNYDNVSENLKRLQENFRLELAAAIEAHVAKIEEISDEMQRLVSENEAFRKQLALNNIEPGMASFSNKNELLISHRFKTNQHQ
jgi:aspartokinase